MFGCMSDKPAFVPAIKVAGAILTRIAFKRRRKMDASVPPMISSSRIVHWRTKNWGFIKETPRKLYAVSLLYRIYRCPTRRLRDKLLPIC